MKVVSARRFDPRTGLRGFLFLDALARATIWAVAAAASAVVVVRLRWWPEGIDPIAHPWRAVKDGATALVAWILLFNVAYVLVLVVSRLPLRTPREGRYAIGPGARPGVDLVLSCACAILTKARYHPPFPGFLVFNLANVPPLVWLMGPVFGPRSRSCYVVDPTLLDPHLTVIGRNVTIGFGTVIAAHSQERDALIIKRTVIEDDVLMGGNCIIYGGCTVRRGAVILAGAVVRPDTVIGENELWGGLPARKIKDLPAYDEPAPASTGAPGE